MKLLKQFAEFNKKTNDYIWDEDNHVCERNRHLLLITNIVYFFVLGAYNIIVPIFFSAWHVTRIYQSFLLIQAVVMILMWVGFHNKDRSIRAVQHACLFFHFFVMTFIILVSILPVEMEQPAMYFAPILMGFTVVFMFKWHTIVVTVFIETVLLNVMSFCLKSKEIFNINLYSSILAMCMTIFLTHVIYSSYFRDAENKKQLEIASRTDTLTQIYNRRAMEDSILQYMKKHPDGDYALLMMDVYYFKKINDSLGHPVGDFVLASFAKIISEAAGTQNIVGRVGGDEFMVFVKHGGNRLELMNIVEQIQRKTMQIPLPSGRRRITCSIGVCPPDSSSGISYETMFKCADEALYCVKKRGRNGYAFFDELDLGESDN